MGFNWATTSDKPLVIYNMPSVATKGGIFILVTISPLNMPHNAPVTNPATIPTNTGICQIIMTCAVMTAENVMTVPTERSMPPLMMTKVTPKARIPFTAAANIFGCQEVRRSQAKHDEEDD